MEEKFTDLYNKTGIPFQYWCLTVLRRIENYEGVPEFSFTHPPSIGAQLGKSSSIDILAQRIPPSDKRKWFNGLILFFIECKRADPEIKDWVFSKDPDKLTISPTYFLKRIDTNEQLLKLGIKSWKHEIERQGVFPGLGYMGMEDLDYCLQGVEFKKDLSDINRKQEELIYKPLLQANHALNALFCRPIHLLRHMEGLDFFPALEEKINTIFFMPVVVTTANLYIADYDPQKVDMKSGKINKEDIRFDGPKKWLTFEFALPDYLKHTGEEECEYEPISALRPLESRPKKKEIMIKAERITTFVVNSDHWKEFLEKFDFYL